MAVTINNLVTNCDQVDRTAYTTASISPTANRVLIMLAGGAGNYPSSITGAGVTWTTVNSVTSGGSYARLYVACPSSPSAGAITINFASSSTFGFWSIVECVDALNTGSNGDTAIVQSVANNGLGSGGSLTVTMGTFQNTLNATLGMMGTSGGGGQTISVGSGFTLLGRAVSGGDTRVCSEYKTTNDTSVDWSWSTTDGTTLGFGVEVRPAYPTSQGIIT